VENSDAPSVVKDLFSELVKKQGFRPVVSNQIESFDQISLVLSSDTFDVRFVRDRGAEFLEIGCETEWFSIELVRTAAFGGQLQDLPVDIEGEALFVSSHLAQIRQLFEPDQRNQTLCCLEELRKKKTRIMFPDSFWS